MDTLLSNVRITVSDKLYKKDPESSELGREILAESVQLLNDIGLEHFTFRKLGEKINSPEASIYRYFENKHKLLLYLSSWFWGWMEYRLVFDLANVKSPQDRLKKSVDLITESDEIFYEIELLDVMKLKQVVRTEFAKAYLTKDVDMENKEGAYKNFKRFVARISDIILELAPDYPYPHMLVSTIIEGAHHQYFYAQHIPALTDFRDGENCIGEFYTDLILTAVSNRRKK